MDYREQSKLEEPTTSNKQSMWRAVGILERKKLIITKIEGISRYRGSYDNKLLNPSN